MNNDNGSDVCQGADADMVSAVGVVDAEVAALQALRGQLSDENSTLARHLTEALNLMQYTNGRVIVTGIGKSGHIGRKIAASLSSTGTPAFFVHPAEASHGDLGMITNQDIVLAISTSGESKELLDILNYCKRFDIKLIAITQKENSTLAKNSDVVLLLPDRGEACPLGVVPTNSTTLTLVMGDILTVRLIARRGFSKLDFNDRHPGGKLGSILRRVSDLMHKGSDMPLLSEESDMQSVLLEMSAKRLGCVGLIDQQGELVGMLTDGDLRRCFSAQTLTEPACKLMTKHPKTIAPDLMASELLKLMNQWKITNIFVVYQNKPIGVVHIHDLLASGIA